MAEETGHENLQKIVGMIPFPTLVVDHKERVIAANSLASEILQVAGSSKKQLIQMLIQAAEASEPTVVQSYSEGVRLYKVASTNHGEDRLLVLTPAPEISDEERRLRLLVDGLPSGALIVEGEAVWFNRAAEQLLGYKREEIPTLTQWFEALYSGKSGEVQNLYQSIRKCDELKPITVELRRKDGSVREVEFSGTRTATGEVWMLTDITDAMASRKKFEAIFNLSIEPHLLFDGEGNLIDCNPAAVEFLQYESADQLRKRQIDEISPKFQPDGKLSSKKCVEMAKLARKNKGHRFEWVHEKSTGEGVLVEVSATPIPIGEDIGVLVIWRDLTERKLAETAIREAHEDLETAQSIAKVGSWQGILATEESWWSAETHRIFGVPMTSTPPTYREIMNYVHGDDLPGFMESVEKLIAEGGSMEQEFRLITPAGQLKHVRAVAQLDPMRNIIQGTIQDLTDLVEQRMLLQQQMQQLSDLTVALELRKYELEEANEALARLAQSDGLTGLPNHRAFQEQYAREFNASHRSDRPLSIVMVDVDRFKLYNDSHGHPAGDQVLKLVGECLQNCVRGCDLVARYGGEEFVLLLPETDEMSACMVAERAREAIEAMRETLQPVTASFGVATLTSRRMTREELLELADKALYQSKHNGRNRTTHCNELHAAA